jgi:hypothetical protein
MLGTDYDTHNVLADFVFSLIMIREQPASDLTFIPSFPFFKKIKRMYLPLALNVFSTALSSCLLLRLRLFLTCVTII